MLKLRFSPDPARTGQTEPPVAVAQMDQRDSIAWQAGFLLLLAMLVFLSAEWTRGLYAQDTPKADDKPFAPFEEMMQRGSQPRSSLTIPNEGNQPRGSATSQENGLQPRSPFRNPDEGIRRSSPPTNQDDGFLPGSPLTNPTNNVRPAERELPQDPMI